MQLLAFTVAGQDFAIESRRVVEVLPLVPARPIPLAPDYVRGVFTYRGRLVPLIDLARRLGAVAFQERLSTRVIVVDLAAHGAAPRLLGMVAENVISICSADAADTSLPRLEMPNAAFLGRLLRIEGRMVQVIAIEHLLPADVSAGLFPDPVATERA
jgi:chemotaxis-related protein WspB